VGEGVLRFALGFMVAGYRRNSVDLAQLRFGLGHFPRYCARFPTLLLAHNQVVDAPAPSVIWLTL
jgi:hypothetical protein